MFTKFCLDSLTSKTITGINSPNGPTVCFQQLTSSIYYMGGLVFEYGSEDTGSNIRLHLACHEQVFNECHTLYPNYEYKISEYAPECFMFNHSLPYSERIFGGPDIVKCAYAMEAKHYEQPFSLVGTYVYTDEL